ncbi:hypothetical protein PR048_005549 [Dryococelus australis]|uniref:BESS domain-containing protein n=1 Tax=Dryococelus australis TaxID=614101 RepID=A0ABQ9I8K5_9NEOP|nr:hypothetical protein PR048_005549 [Dryococelus australis]
MEQWLLELDHKGIAASTLREPSAPPFLLHHSGHAATGKTAAKQQCVVDNVAHCSLPAGNAMDAEMDVEIFIEELIEFKNTPAPKPVPQQMDDDRSFFDSLLPALRSPHLHARLEFRSEVLEVLCRFVTRVHQYPGPQEENVFQPSFRCQEYTNYSAASPVSSISHRSTTPMQYTHANAVGDSDHSMDLFSTGIICKLMRPLKKKSNESALEIEPANGWAQLCQSSDLEM